MTARPLASIVIPTWNAPTTLGPAIASARAQTVADIEILVVADGASPETLDVARVHASLDSRVRVCDRPKAPSRGEANRHWGVLTAASPSIVYLADDDLLLPRHVENLLPLLAEHDLVQSLNGWIDGQGELHLLVADLGDPRWREFHLIDPPLNRISITGTAHSAEAYRRLAEGWVVPREPGIAADLTFWRQFLAIDDMSAATHPEMTTLQFPAPQRRDMTQEQLAEVRQHWESFIERPDAHEALQALVAHAAFRDLHASSLDVRALTFRLTRTRAQIDELRDELTAHRATLSWRVTRPLRALRARTRRRGTEL